MTPSENRPILTPPPWSKSDLVCIVLLFFIVVSLHCQSAVLGCLSLDEDTLLYFYPLRALSQDDFVGFWNPYMFCGFPRDGNPQSQLFYPPNAVLAFLPVSAAYPLLLVGHLFIGVLGIYFLTRYFGCGPLASFVAGLACAGGSFWQCKAMNLGNMEGNSWIPWLLLAFVYGLERGNVRWAVLSAVFAGLIVSAGAPHPVVYAAVFCVLFFLCVLSKNWWATLRFEPTLQRSEQTLQRLLGYVLLVLILTAGLTVWMWLPVGDYLPDSNRGPLEPEEAYAGALGLKELPGTIFCGLTQPESARLDPWEGTLFFGSAGLILAGIGIWTQRRNRAVWVLAFSTLLGVLIALGPNTPVYPLLRRFVPGVEYLNLPNRSLLLGAWSIPILIGFGAQYFSGSGRTLVAWRTAAAVLGLLFLAAWIYIASTYDEHLQTLINPALTETFARNHVPDMIWSLWGMLLWGALACLVLGIPKHPRWGRKPHFIGLAVLILSQEAYVRPRFLFQFTSPDYYYKPPWVVQRVRDWVDPADERVLGYSKAIPIAGDVRCNWIFDHLSSRLPEIYGVREIQGYDPVYPRVYGELIRAWAGQSRAAGTVRHVRIWNLPRQMVDFLGVRFIVGDPSARLCLLPNISLGPGEEKTIRLPEPIPSYRLFVRHVCDGMETSLAGSVFRQTSFQERSFPPRFDSSTPPEPSPILMASQKVENTNFNPLLHLPRSRGRKKNERVCVFSPKPGGDSEGVDTSLSASRRLFATTSILGRETEGNLTTVPDGGCIGQVIVRDENNETRLLPVRYRVDVGDIIAVNPGAARVFRWWPVPTSEGLLPAADYWTQWSVDPVLAIQSVAFRNVAESGTWMLHEMVLSDANRVTYPRVLETARSGADIYENPSAFPPAWIASACRVISDATERIDAIVSNETDLRTTVILEEKPDNPPQQIPPADTVPDVDFERPSSDEMICRIPEKTTGWLIVAESYGRWWNATIDGKPVPIHRANHAFMAVPLIEQSGTVQFLYRPLFFYAGCLVSGVTVAGCGVMVLLARGKSGISPRG